MARLWEDIPHYRRGRPALVEFHGFRSDTHLLENQGWRIAEEVDQYRFSMSHEIKLILSSPCENPIKFIGRCRVPHDLYDRQSMGFSLRICVDPQHFHDYRVHHELGWQSSARFREIDMSHTIAEAHCALDWGSIFPPRAASKEDVFMAGADMGVIEHLEAIKRLQAPKQKELRLKAESKSVETVARLIQVA